MTPLINIAPSRPFIPFACVAYFSDWREDRNSSAFVESRLLENPNGH